MNIVKLDPTHKGFDAALMMASESRCAKQPVGAAIFDTSMGLLGAGNNDCDNPQRACPREVEGCESGDGYWMCKYLCQQKAHAEVNAVENALSCVPESLLKGSTLYMWGHSYSCDNCTALCESVGIRTIAFVNGA